MTDRTVSEVGEKALIAEFVRPIFDGIGAVPVLGNDCAVVRAPADHDMLLSTDRVPADLIAFRLGIIDHFGLGRYLACLNISDIAACGGDPAGLLLNMGIPEQLSLRDFEAICRGVREAAELYDCAVVGGDISASSELSLSVTSVGFVPTGQALTRAGARPGDRVFVSKALGMTPAAFAYFLSVTPEFTVPAESEACLKAQFTDVAPLVGLGRSLRISGLCTACMDNTDGVGQSLSEIAAESGCAVVLDRQLIEVPDIVGVIARAARIEPMDLALGPGADFSLIGTLRDDWAPDDADGEAFRIIGHVTDGTGVHIADGPERVRLKVKGWDYFIGEVERP